VFDINVPIGVAVSLLSFKYISTTTTRRTGSYEKRHLDIFGAVSALLTGIGIIFTALLIQEDIVMLEL